MRKEWPIIAALFLFTFGLYVRTIRFDFVNYDDDQYVFDNQRVLQGWTLSNVGWAFTTGEASNWHPLTWLSLMADVSIFGQRPGGHHFTNALLHAINASLLFVALRRLTGNRWPAAACAAVFALHPLRVESVAWIAERKDVLCGLFWMLTLIAYERYVHRPAGTAAAGRYLLVLAMLVLGLLAKPMLVTMPFVLLLLDYWPLRRLERFEGEEPSPLLPPRVLGRGIVHEKLPMIGIVMAACIATYVAQSAGKAVASQTYVPIVDRFANAAISCVVYIQQTIWPTSLAPFYPHPRAIPGDRVDLKLAGVCAAAILLGCAAAWLWRRRAPWFTVGWLWYLGTLVPVIGIVQVGEQAHADRYTYIPTIGLAIAVTWSLAAAGRRWPETRVPIATAVMLAIVCFGILAHRQIGYWRDSETLWRHGTAVVANSFVGHNNLGEALYRKERIDAAAAEFRKTLAIKPEDAMALNNTGVILIRRGRGQEAKDYLKRSIQRDPFYAPAYVHLGNIYAREGRPVDAIMLYRQAIQRKPDFANGYHNLAVTLAQKGDYAEAIENWRKGLELREDDADMHHHLGVALLMTGRTAEGLDQLRSALNIAPDRADTLMRLSWVLATHPRAELRDPSSAVEMAQRAVELTNRKDPESLDTLAAAEAAAGHFGAAASAAETALRLVTSENPTLRAAIEQRLALYRANRPFVQTRPATLPATIPS